MTNRGVTARRPVRNPRMMGRRALVTGGASGIGRASVLRLAADGAGVAVVDVRPGAADPVAEEVRAAGGLAIALTCDVRDEASVGAATRAAADAIGGLDTVVACAGITATGATHSVALADWQLVISVNLTGVFLVVKHSLPHLLDAGGGAIVTIGSTASLVAAGRTASYDASKGGVLQFTRAIAVEYVDQGIRANCVCPGVVSTGLATHSRALDAPWDGDGVAGPSARLRVPMSRRGSVGDRRGGGIPVLGRGVVPDRRGDPRRRRVHRDLRESEEPTLTNDLGDPMPAALAGYYADLDAGRMKEAVEHFSADTLSPSRRRTASKPARADCFTVATNCWGGSTSAVPGATSIASSSAVLTAPPASSKAWARRRRPAKRSQRSWPASNSTTTG